MRYLTYFLIIFTLLSYGCVKREGPARHEKRYGVNGEAVYILKENNDISMMYKEEYRNDKFEIFINNDTIEVGDTLHSIILASGRDFRILVKAPSDETIVSDGSSKVASYEFVPDHPGLYDYRGVVEYDTFRLAFHYKFIVN